MSTEEIELLRRMPVFGGLSSATLEMILEQSETRSAGAGEYFFHQNDPANSVYVIQSGSVVVEKQWNGMPVIVSRLQTGACFGEMSLIDLQSRSASVRAATECRTIRISIRLLHDLYRQNLEQYAIIMMNMGREVSRRFRVTSDRLFELEQEQKSGLQPKSG